MAASPPPGPLAPERMPGFVGATTLAIGAALVVSPRLATGPLGLQGRETAVRLIGLSDLALVPGLLRGDPRWPWMAARAGMNLAVAGYLHSVTRHARRPAATRALAAVMAGLTVVDGATGLALRQADRAG